MAAWPVSSALQAASPRGGLARATLHELYAASEADAPGLSGAVLALAALARPQRSILWVRHSFLDREAGGLYAPGLAEFGLDPARLTLVSVRDVQSALQAGLEGARCPALGAVVVELWGEARALDLTASRRLAMAAKASGTPVFLARIAATPQPSVAETRWQVRGAPSRALGANAPGNPAFSFTLLKHRGGFEGGEWHLEWNRDHGCFEERALQRRDRGEPRHGAALSGPVVPLSVDRQGGAAGARHRFG